jgi:hypothetical protein
VPAWLSFPDPVNEVAARTVAAGVAVTAAAAAVADQPWLSLPLAYGFVARVASGPRFSPWALVATKVVVPRLPFAERPVAGTPKRFAQGIGAALTGAAAVAHFAFDAGTGARLALGAVAVAATLEAALGYCLGCRAYAGLVRLGVAPAAVCEACADLPGAPAPQQAGAG